MTTNTSVCDVGYIAQRSTNPQVVAAFLKSLPPGTLENGVETIPNFEDIKRRFKLRSPKMTKALINLGVDPDVVSGYYSAFSKRATRYHVFHMTTFPHPQIMNQQSDSTHYSSCMSSGYLDGTGSYYDAHINDDVKAYERGDLGMWVVGNHAGDVRYNNEAISKGDEEGFVARAKIRVLYNTSKNGNIYVVGSRAALLVDRIYGSTSSLMDNLNELIEWNQATYNLPILLSVRSEGDLIKLQPLSAYDVSDELIFLGGGYQDSLIDKHRDVQRVGEEVIWMMASTLCKNTSEFGVLDTTTAIKVMGAQYRVFKSLRKSIKERGNEYIPPIEPSKAYLERSTNSLVVKKVAEVKTPSWRFDEIIFYRSDRSRKSKLLKAKLLTTTLGLPILKTITDYVGLSRRGRVALTKYKSAVTFIDCETNTEYIPIDATNSLAVSLECCFEPTYEDVLRFILVLSVVQPYQASKEDEREYYECASYALVYSQNEEGEWTLMTNQDTVVSQIHDMNNTVAWRLGNICDPGWVSVPEESLVKAGALAMRIIEHRESFIPPVDKLSVMRYNKKRIKKLLKL